MITITPGVVPFDEALVHSHSSVSALVPLLEHVQRQVVVNARHRVRDRVERKKGELEKIRALKTEGAKKITEARAEDEKRLEGLREQIDNLDRPPTRSDPPAPVEESLENFSDTKPSWGAFTCLDGFAWLRRKRCGRSGLVPYSTALVAPAIDAHLSPIERILALRKLVLLREVNVIRILYPHHCQCGESHHYEGLEFLRMTMAIHEGAIPALLRARPSLRKLKFVDMPPQLRRDVKHPERFGLPVRDPRWRYRNGPPEDEATRIAQVSWACMLMAESEER